MYILYVLIKGMVTFDGNSHLDSVFQSDSTRVTHKETTSVYTNKEDFYMKWDSILYDTERKLVEPC